MATHLGNVSELWRFPFKSMAGELLPSARLGVDGIVGDRGWALRDERAGEIRGAKKLPSLLQCSARYTSEPGTADPAHVRIELPDGVSFSSADADASARLSRFLGRDVTIWPRRPVSDLDHYRRGVPDNPDFDAELRAIFGRTPDEPLPDLTMFSPEILEFTSPLGTYFDVFPLHLLTSATLSRLSELQPNATFDRRRFRPNILIASAEGQAGSPEAEWCGRTIEIGEAAVRCEMPTVRCSMITQAQDGLPKDPSVLRTVVRDAGQNAGVYASIVRPGRIAVGDEVRLA
jgi:uncharacterized protein YcbX